MPEVSERGLTEHLRRKPEAALPREIPVPSRPPELEIEASTAALPEIEPVMIPNTAAEARTQSTIPETPFVHSVTIEEIIDAWDSKDLSKIQGIQSRFIQDRKNYKPNLESETK